ncbi:RhoGAP [Acrasis kona]|uniref:RhoGAP n=1 Tax=Acrasis kona TaxID=1008807 RepID=A0AAW2ZFR7_9EUKA
MESTTEQGGTGMLRVPSANARVLSCPGLVLTERVTPIFRQSIFGVSNRDDHEDFTYRIPIVVRHCCYTLYRAAFRSEDDGIKKEGIFRVTASTKSLNEAKHIYDDVGYARFCENNHVFSVMNVFDAHVVAGVLKLYLRELQCPLISRECYNVIIDAVKQNKSAGEVAKLTKICIEDRLSSLEAMLLNVVLFLLNETSKVSGNMNSTNLGIIFGPIFFQSTINTNSSAVLENVKEMQYTNKASSILIEHYNMIFSGEEDYIQKIYYPIYQERHLLEEDEEVVVYNMLSDEYVECTESLDITTTYGTPSEMWGTREERLGVIQMEFDSLINKSQEPFKTELYNLMEKIKLLL